MMFYYMFNINDFYSETRHLTLVERAILFELQNFCYSHERAININELEALFRKICIISDDHKCIARKIIEEFFLLKDDCFHLERVDNDIAKYKKNLEYKSVAGKKSAASRSKSNTNNKEINTCLTVVHNQEPVNNNQEPVNKNQEPLDIDHDSNREMCSPEQMIKLWNPTINEINDYLTISNLPMISNEKFRREQIRFLYYYYESDIKDKKINVNQLMSKFSRWLVNADRCEKISPKKNKQDDRCNWELNKNLEKLKEEIE